MCEWGVVWCLSGRCVRSHEDAVAPFEVHDGLLGAAEEGEEQRKKVERDTE